MGRQFPSRPGHPEAAGGLEAKEVGTARGRRHHGPGAQFGEPLAKTLAHARHVFDAPFAHRREATDNGIRIVDATPGAR
jgi:hypothetical protein